LFSSIQEHEMFASRRSLFPSSRRRAQRAIATTVGLAAASAAIAAAAVYLLDPKSGKHRREVLRDRVARASRQSYDMASKLGRGTYQRATGMYRQSKRHLRSVGAAAPF
jgi:hypothetical protein